MKLKSFIIFSIVLFLLTGCNNQRQSETEAKGELSATMRNNITLFFGHKSVGNNILSGVKSLTQSMENPIQIIESSTVTAQDGFYHVMIGENLKPITKIDGFASHIRNGWGDNADIAFLKLCYADINTDSDVNEVFNYYVKIMDSLQDAYPQLKLVHITVPLESIEKNWLKNIIKTMLGRSTQMTSNKVREQFNSLMRSKYQESSYFFDIAYYESLSPSGSVNTKKGVPYMDTTYTNDGGHLNEEGQIHIASALLNYICEIQ